jgi:TolB-like protein
VNPSHHRVDSERTVAGEWAAEIRDQLERILSSSDFAVPERARKFLRYVVEETLAGRGDRIKGYSIATQVFNRSETFDSQSDPAVRIEAGRVRRALERYYLVAGKNDPIVTTIPKGGYLPLFERRDTEGPTNPAAGPGGSDPRERRSRATYPSSSHYEVPSILVVPFSDLGDGRASKVQALGLTAEVIHQLATFKELVVIVGREPDLHEDPRDDPGDTGGNRRARYALEGSVRSSRDRIRFAARLVDRDSGAVLWSGAYDGDLSVKDLVAFQEEAAQRVATIVGQPYGIVFQADLARTTQHPDDKEAYSCTLAYFAYRAELDPRQHESVRNSLECVVERFPSYATAWALLSLIYLDEDRFEFNVKPDAPAPLDRALDAANRAVNLDPDNVRALQAQMLAKFFKQQVDAAFAVGERALALNPNDTELCSELGVRHVTSGDRKKGVMLLQRALSRNPAHADYYFAQLAIAAFHDRDLDNAVRFIRKVNLGSNPIYLLTAAAIYAQSGLNAEAKRAAERVLALRPSFLKNPNLEFAKRNISPEVQAYFVEGFRKAGLPV